MRRAEKDPESGYRDEAGLKEGLEPTLRGLKEMQIFLEAVEKLTVTSAHVFDQNLVQLLSEETDLESVKRIISFCRLISATLLSFKRDNAAFFSPKLENLEVMKVQLKQYITNIKHICGFLRQESLTDLCLDIYSVDVDLSGVSEGDIEQMFLHLKLLQEIRDDKHFRTVFLFQDRHRTFMDEFRQKKKVMLQFLEDVEICAVKLDKMTKGTRISNVAGSSVGVVGGILSIVGLALIPVTFGASMALIGTGAGLGVLSGASAVTTLAVEKGVNHTQKKEAEKRFGNFMEDMNFLQNCLDDVINQHIENVPENPITPNPKMANDCASVFKGGNIIGKGAEVGVAAAKGAVAIGKAARGGFIALNAIFIGVDVFLIVNNSIDLYKGAPNEDSKFLRARAALWKSEINSMQQICDSLEEGQQQYEDKKQQLQRLFYEG
ncbi:apolipoprotein L4-like [Boleophthalmus pectinirostris]|uniref:apolipoprotein L4-like n=1 Tax=Boleophthalmus pectinirostris TaxID=150288 RepID=UPI00242B5256|nr:apolipoprotein L4-like [Boleophthalmus pectinirostris]